VAVEEEAKRRTLLRYIHAVKAAASLGLDDESHKNMTAAVGRPGRGIIQLPESGVTDEEVHAIAALLRGNSTIAELNLRNNEITDEGASALGAVLAGRMGLRSVDLRSNRISKQGIRTIAEALERSERVRHVYVHAGGKATLGTGVWAAPRGGADPQGASADRTSQDHNPAAQSPAAPSGRGATVPLVTVETVCVVDLRENKPPSGGGVGAAALAVAMEDPAAPLPPGAGLGGGAGGGGTAPVFATSVLPGELSASVVSSAGGGGVGARGKSDRASNRPAFEVEGDTPDVGSHVLRGVLYRNKQMELGWAGRTGGLDARPTSKGSVSSSNSRGGGLPRVSRA
ncbi:unnamed protein product, partial [Scytosiphon promiscuus]